MPPSINDSKAVLVTGATSGIGRALASSIAALPSHPQVIGTGRRSDRLAELRNSKIDARYLEVDSDKESLTKFVHSILAEYPELDTLIMNAGIQQDVDLKATVDLDSIYREINTNYLSVVTLVSLFLPHLLKLSKDRPCFVVLVTSGLGIIPGPSVANYSASKAALRSFTVCLQAELADTNVHVIEIIPPLVESELHDASGTTEKLSKIWMPLSEFTEHTMAGLKNGDRVIACGMAQKAYEQFEKHKYDVVLTMARRVGD